MLTSVWESQHSYAPMIRRAAASTSMDSGRSFYLSSGAPSSSANDVGHGELCSSSFLIIVKPLHSGRKCVFIFLKQFAALIDCCLVAFSFEGRKEPSRSHSICKRVIPHYCGHRLYLATGDRRPTVFTLECTQPQGVSLRCESLHASCVPTGFAQDRPRLVVGRGSLN